MTATRRLAAMLAADVAGYSRLIGGDEGGSLHALKVIRAELIDPTIAAHNGRLVKTTGSSTEVLAGLVDRVTFQNSENGFLRADFTARYPVYTCVFWPCGRNPSRDSEMRVSRFARNTGSICEGPRRREITRVYWRQLR